MAKQQPLVEIYDRVEMIYAQKGMSSLWPKERYKHPFKPGVLCLGVVHSGMYRMKAGDVILRSKKHKRLWKTFKYGEEDL